MSIEQLRSDTAAVVAALPTGPLTSAAVMADYMKNNFLPLFEDLIGELDQMDGAIAELVAGSADVLHRDSSMVFLTLIEGGSKIIADLQAYITELGGVITGETSQAIKEWNTLADSGREILEDVTFDGDDDDDVEDDEDENQDDEESTKAASKK